MPRQSEVRRKTVPNVRLNIKTESEDLPIDIKDGLHNHRSIENLQQPSIRQNKIKRLPLNQNNMQSHKTILVLLQSRPHETVSEGRRIPEDRKLFEIVFS